MSVEPFPYPVPNRRGMTATTTRLVSGQSYRSIVRLLLLLLLLVLQLLELGIHLMQLVVR